MWALWMNTVLAAAVPSLRLLAGVVGVMLELGMEGEGEDVRVDLVVEDLEAVEVDDDGGVGDDVDAHGSEVGGGGDGEGVSVVAGDGGEGGEGAVGGGAPGGVVEADRGPGGAGLGGVGVLPIAVEEEEAGVEGGGVGLVGCSALEGHGELVEVDALVVGVDHGGDGAGAPAVTVARGLGGRGRGIRVSEVDAVLFVGEADSIGDCDAGGGSLEGANDGGALLVVDVPGLFGGGGGVGLLDCDAVLSSFTLGKN